MINYEKKVMNTHYFIIYDDDNYNVYLKKNGRLNARCRNGKVKWITRPFTEKVTLPVWLRY